jgi:hypothetical protein
VAYYWAYEIPKPVTAPLKITVDRVNYRKHNTAQIQFNTGEHPQVMQKWDLNLPVKLGPSDFVIESIVFLGNGYKFELSSANLPEGVTPDIEILDSSLSPYQFENSSSTIDNTRKAATVALTAKSPAPIGNLTVKWGLEELIVQPGPWSLVWAPSIDKP